MRPNIRLNKHPHGYIWGNTYLFINQRKSAIISQIYRWHIFYMDRLWKRTTTLSIINQRGITSIKFDFNYPNTLLRHNNNKNIYRNSFNNTIQKRNHLEILCQSKIRTPWNLIKHPNSQALRLKKICTTNEDFTEQSKGL